MTKDKEWRICWVDGEQNHVLFIKPDFVYDKHYTKFIEHQALVEAKAENERLRGALAEFAKDEWPDVTPEFARQALKTKGET